MKPAITIGAISAFRASRPCPLSFRRFQRAIAKARRRGSALCSGGPPRGFDGRLTKAPSGKGLGRFATAIVGQ